MAAEKQDVVTTAGATPMMCANNGCGFFGSAATKNFCSQCYKNHVMMKNAAAAAPVAEKKVDAAPAAEKEKREGSSGVTAVAEKKVDAAPAPAADQEGGSSSETTDKHEAASAAAAAAAPVMCASANGCTFFGSAATKNMCSSCYRDFLKNAHPAPVAAAAKIEAVAPDQPAPPEIAAATSTAPPAAKAVANRCAGCKKKVGLLGFVCRCGGTFCSVHRYTDQHACNFDFKTAAREQIAKKNPLVVAPKINKI